MFFILSCKAERCDFNINRKKCIVVFHYLPRGKKGTTQSIKYHRNSSFNEVNLKLKSQTPSYQIYHKLPLFRLWYRPPFSINSVSNSLWFQQAFVNFPFALPLEGILTAILSDVQKVEPGLRGSRYNSVHCATEYQVVNISNEVELILGHFNVKTLHNQLMEILCCCLGERVKKLLQQHEGTVVKEVFRLFSH